MALKSGFLTIIVSTATLFRSIKVSTTSALISNPPTLALPNIDPGWCKANIHLLKNTHKHVSHTSAIFTICQCVLHKNALDVTYVY